ncbi:CatB-related O-acetyltransferase [Mediterranea massiliensis]|uniref:CatB-related O-acetyltransferase n=1 Tax=Mediterranea massiliensis TaxID=1841865 RepID=A0ABS2E403_9BACT|nr:CatB-related O-acetyltransferase [Mediterranea massiliensis]MBM6736329.1 CatB-related O-acetyltransferase [Mediterranea massiliensis]
MTLGYLYGKFVRKVLIGNCLLHSKIDATSVVYSGSNLNNVTMGAYSYCGYDCWIINAKIGAFCSIADHVYIGGAEHPIDWVSTSPVFEHVKNSGPTIRFSKHALPKSKQTLIENDVWIGHGAIIKAGICIGNGAIVGAGAVVTKDVPPYAIVVGSPAKVIKYRFNQDIIEQLIKTEWWSLNVNQLKQLAQYIKNPEIFVEKVNLLINK